MGFPYQNVDKCALLGQIHSSKLWINFLLLISFVKKIKILSQLSQFESVYCKGCNRGSIIHLIYRDPETISNLTFDDKCFHAKSRPSNQDAKRRISYSDISGTPKKLNQIFSFTLFSGEEIEDKSNHQMGKN